MLVLESEPSGRQASVSKTARVPAASTVTSLPPLGENDALRSLPARTRVWSGRCPPWDPASHAPRSTTPHQKHAAMPATMGSNAAESATQRRTPAVRGDAVVPTRSTASATTTRPLQLVPRPFTWSPNPKEKMERLRGIEPRYQAWEASALPLCYSRIYAHFECWEAVGGLPEHRGGGWGATPAGQPGKATDARRGTIAGASRIPTVCPSARCRPARPGPQTLSRCARNS